MFVYIVECADQSYYTGVAKDVARRVEQHNAGRGAKYTASHGPVRLVFQEPQPDWGAALKREHEIKTWPRDRKVRLVQGTRTARPPAPRAAVRIRRKKLASH